MLIEGIAAWAFLSKPKPAGKTKDGKTIPSVYTINVILEPDVAKELKSQGLNVKKIEQDIKGIDGAIGKGILQIKKPAEYDGTATEPPVVVDAKKNPFSGIVGNGSKVKVVFATKEWESFGTKGVAAKLRKVQILDLVPYEAEDLEDFDEEDGFTATSTAASTANSSDGELEDF